MSIQITYVSSLGHQGPKATRVSFDLIDGVRTWAWIPNQVLANVVPGTRVSAENVRLFGKVESTYTDKDGTVITKRVPTQQIVFGGNVVFDAPEVEPMEEVTFVTTEQAEAYAQAVRAKATTASTTDDPFA